MSTNRGPFLIVTDAENRIGGLYYQQIRFDKAPHEPTIKLMDVEPYQGRLVDASGDPVVGAQVTPLCWYRSSIVGMSSLGHFYLSPDRIVKSTGQTDEHGRFVIRDLPEIGSLCVKIEADGFSWRYCAFNLGEATTIQLDRTGRLVGRVSAPESAADLSGIQVGVQGSDTQEPNMQDYHVYLESSRTQTVSDQHGRFALDLLPGEYEVSLRTLCFLAPCKPFKGKSLIPATHRLSTCTSSIRVTGRAY